MGRAIVAVVVSYLVMALFIMVLFSGAYLVLKADGAFQPGSYEPSGTWIAISCGVGLLGGILGGWACMAIGRSTRVVNALVGLVLVLGALSAIAAFTEEKSTEPRTEEVAQFDAMMKAQPPAWIAIVNPLIGVAGVLIGARLGKKKD